MTMSSQAYSVLAFKRKVNDALIDIERILAIEKKPMLAEEVEHTYESKYELVTRVANVAIIAYMNTLNKLGLDEDILKVLDNSTSTTLRFEASTSCKFLKKKVVDVPLDTSCEEATETKSTGILGNTKAKRISKVLQHIQEWHYKVETSWCVSIYSATDVAGKKVINMHAGSTTLITQSDEKPFPEHKYHNPIEVSLTWLLRQMDRTNLTSNFRVNVEEKKTRTPRRNEAIEQAIVFSDLLKKWSVDVSTFLKKLESTILHKHNPALPSDTKAKEATLRNANNLGVHIFNPVLPLMNNGEMVHATAQIDRTENKSLLKLQSCTEEKVLLSSTDMTQLLNEHFNSLGAALAKAEKSFPSDKRENIVAFSEATLSLLTFHLPQLCNNFCESMAYVEKMMEDHLNDAIGKRITPDDLDTYVKFQNARSLNPMPKPFSHAVRRPEHNPVGLVSIESNSSVIHTHTRAVANSTLKMPLNAATILDLNGKQYLHGWLNHKFDKHYKEYQLVSRARQFSAFILCIGTLTGTNTIEPKHGIIIQNKDEVFIPLLLNELPTAKEFKDAIESLSPEQQDFAKAYRSMQLQSSILGCVIIQIKPQLEALLGLPTNALDKEMKLTQDLMELFTEFQVPSDLLSYNGRHEGVALEDKLDNVSKNVKAVMDVIESEKKREMELAKAKTNMAIEHEFQRVCDYDDVEETEIVGCKAALRSPAANYSRRSKVVPAEMAASSLVSREMTVSPPVRANTQSRHRGLRKLASSRYSAEVDARPAAADQHQRSGDELDRANLARDRGNSDVAVASDVVDFTLLPKLLDTAIEKLNDESSMRSTIIKTGQEWVRNRQENLLSGRKKKRLGIEEIKLETNKAFDLLDALGRSGSLPIESSELHVIVCASHCFQKDIISTIIEDNINPIQKLESSTILFASTIHGINARHLIKDQSELDRLARQHPLLLKDSDEEEEDFTRLASC